MINLERIFPILFEQQRTFIAEGGGTSASTVIRRPKWDDVYRGYPKNASGTDDLPAPDVFKEILGENYDTSIFNNACATRVSLGLIGGNMSVRKDFMIQTGVNKGKGFITSARGLKQWLEKDSVWGSADVNVAGQSDINSVADRINDNGVKNGVYIILGGFGGGISGHATLWIGNNRDVIGGHNYVDYGGDIYFWELK